MLGNLTHTRPAADKKLYHLTQVNELVVLLVSTSKTEGDMGKKKAGASLAVETGSFNDPAVMPGLAHYLEHMLFMGSEKYPKENEYDSFVSSKGGYCNASTDGEYTQYNFEIPMLHFFDCLDIFAQCFRAPLLSSTSCQKEVNAIDNEYHLAKVDDDSRLWEVFSCDAVDGHFLRKFGWGNKASLQTQPESEGVDVCDQLRTFYQQYYHPSNCKLVILAPYSLEEMEAAVRNVFGGWNSRSAVATDSKVSSEDIHLTLPHVASLSSLMPGGDISNEMRKKYLSKFSEVFAFSTPDGSPTTRVYRIIPIRKNYHWLTLAWVLPPTIQHYRHKSTEYLCHLLGHEGRGSLLSSLKARGLASQLVAGVNGDCTGLNQSFSVLSLAINLTVKGVINWLEVVKAIYQYLHCVWAAGPQQWILDELAQLALLEYDYQDEEEIDEFVDRLSDIMASRYRRIPQEIDLTNDGKPLVCDLIPSSYKVWEVSEVDIMGALAVLREGDVKVMLMSSLYATGEGSDERTNDLSPCAKKAKLEVCSENEGSSDDDDSDDSGDSEDDDTVIDSSEDVEEEEDEDEVLVDEATIQALYEGPDDAIFRHLSMPPSKNSLLPAEQALIEPHFNTPYFMFQLDHTRYNQLRENTSTDDNKDDNDVSMKMHLPEPNPYIPYELSMLPTTTSASEATTKPTPQPLPIMQQPLLSIWYLEDTQFGLPKAWLHVKLTTWHHNRSPVDTTGVFNSNYIEFVVLNDLVSCVLEDATTEKCYEASLAHLNCEIWSGTDDDVCLNIRVSGFSDKTTVLMQDVLHELIAFTKSNPRDDILLKSQIDRQIEILTCYYSNIEVTAAKASRAARLNHLMPEKVPAATRLEHLHRIKKLLDTSASRVIGLFRDFVNLFLRQCTLVSFLQGNVSHSSAVAFGAHVASILTPLRGGNEADSSVTFNQRNIRHLVATPPHEAKSIPVAIHTLPTNQLETNRAVEIYYQIGVHNGQQNAEEGDCNHNNSTGGHIDLMDLVLLELIDQIITEPFYDSLRTSQQLGYDVSNFVSTISSTYGYVFKIVSNSHNIQHVTSSLLSFIRTDMISLIKSLSVSEVVVHVSALLDKYLLPSVDLAEEAKRHWHEIENARFAFQLHIMKADLLRKSLQDGENGSRELVDRVIAFCNYHFIEQGTCRVLMSSSGHLHESV